MHVRYPNSYLTFVIALVVGAQGVVALLHWPALGQSASVPPPRPEPSDRELARQARSKDEATRQRAVGLLLRRLKPGMTRDQVEALLGPPDGRLIDLAPLGSDDMVGAEYIRRLPGNDYAEMMAVDYDTRHKPWRVVRVSGPHHPAGG